MTIIKFKIVSVRNDFPWISVQYLTCQDKETQVLPLIIQTLQTYTDRLAAIEEMIYVCYWRQVYCRVCLRNRNPAKGVQLENNPCVTFVTMVLFPNQRLLFWSEEFWMTKTTTNDFQQKYENKCYKVIIIIQYWVRRISYKNGPWNTLVKQLYNDEINITSLLTMWSVTCSHINKSEIRFDCFLSATH